LEMLKFYGNLFHCTHFLVLEKGLGDTFRRGNVEINIRHDPYMRNFNKNGSQFFNCVENSDALSVMILVGKFWTIFSPTEVTENEAKCCQHGQNIKGQNVQQKVLTTLRGARKCPSVYTMSFVLSHKLQGSPRITA
jgi:hypothetical protein